MEGRRKLRHRGRHVVRNFLEDRCEIIVERTLKLREVRTTIYENVASGLVLEQCVEQVLESYVLMPIFDGLIDRRAQCCFKLAS